ncbi:outer membrane beta-barrel protein [Shinella curvata]|uniref:Outer membrane beta-barrel protein n=1 Tax=Shinella curvata TaxID=1817964 RepID=A0ABT8XDS5_9HYPH|nr:outer membrane beta-barrel protein [Shinella curvata]MCJ8055486.1 outer membrane beta-barrel protein [Shinella curvata]MDO6121903.1 outer membrane beta-barrel protein [Shinella curvata]
MAEAHGMDRGTAQSRQSRRLAGLLLAGTMLAAMPALAQDATSTADTFSNPLPNQIQVQAGTGAIATETTAGTAAQPALIADQQAAAADDDLTGAIRRTDPEAERLNLPEGTVDNVRSPDGDPYEPTGIRLGTFVLKPSLTQGLGYERNRSGSTATSRTFSQTGIRGSLTSDWSRHQLTIDADGIYQRNLSGTGETEPQLRINGDLRLDLSDDTIVNITGGYAFERESSNDPNAVDGASAQSGVQTLTGGARVTRDFGLIRGTLGTELERRTYGSATLSDGSRLDLSDRNYTEATVTGRIGYELSPALIPYLEASVGRSFYDDKTDSLGYERSATTLGARAGVEVDLGEKLRGDLGLGYEQASFDDNRLDTIRALTVDGSVFWSPQRGTDLRLGLQTQIEPSTAGGQSGYVSYAANAELTHELRDNLVARLSAAYTWRNLPTELGPDQNIYLIGTGLTWNINRWLAVTGDVSYELTRQARASDTGVTRAGIGLVLRR